MTSIREQWTARRIKGVERFLSCYPGDPYATAFLHRLQQSRSLEEKRDLILNDLLPALKAEQSTIVWEGREYETRVTLMALIDDYLHREGVIENIPTYEEDTPEEAAELERLSHLLAKGKPLSEQVIEDRGPR